MIESCSNSNCHRKSVHFIIQKYINVEDLKNSGKISFVKFCESCYSIIYATISLSYNDYIEIDQYIFEKLVTEKEFNNYKLLL